MKLRSRPTSFWRTGRHARGLQAKKQLKKQLFTLPARAAQSRLPKVGLGLGTAYDIYQSAYQTGYEGYGRYPGKSLQAVEADLRRDYEKTRRTVAFGWDKAKHATKDAWLRVEGRQKQNN